MSNEELQRRIEKARKHRAALKKYDDIFMERITFKQLYKIAGREFEDGKAFCAMCQKELDTTLTRHLREFHKTDIGHLLSGNYNAEKNGLLERILMEEVNKEMM